MASDDTFYNIRSFRRSFARVLLHREKELTELQDTLDKLDETDAQNPILEKRLRGWEDYNGYNEDQRQLVSELERRLNAYSK